MARPSRSSATTWFLNWHSDECVAFYRKAIAADPEPGCPLGPIELETGLT